MLTFKRKPKRTICFDDFAEQNNFYKEEVISLKELKEELVESRLTKEEAKYLSWLRRVIFKQHKRTYKKWERGGSDVYPYRDNDAKTKTKEPPPQTTAELQAFVLRVIKPFFEGANAAETGDETAQVTTTELKAVAVKFSGNGTEETVISKTTEGAANDTDDDVFSVQPQ